METTTDARTIDWSNDLLIISSVCTYTMYFA